MKILIGWWRQLTGVEALARRNDELSKRNDFLVAQNNRLGKQVLEARKNVRGMEKKLRKKQPDPPAPPSDISAVKKYKYHIQSRRQDLLVRALAPWVPKDIFDAECQRVNDMTDEEVAAHA